MKSKEKLVTFDYLLNGEIFKVFVTFENKVKKTYRIKMTIDKRIEISIYKKYDLNTIVKFLDKNQDWIKSSSQKFDKYLKYFNENFDIDVSELFSKRKYLYLGKVYDNKLGLDFSYNSFFLKQEFDSMVLHKLYEKITLNYINPPKLIIKKLKSRWGSYNKKEHTITLNLYLLFFSEDIIDYVIFHELTHTLVFNHSKDFYNELVKVCPNYKSIKEKMKLLSLISERLVALEK